MHCIPSLDGGGTERQIQILAEAQAKHGHEVHLIAGRDDPEVCRRLARSGVRVRPLQPRGNHDLRIVTDLCSIVRQVRPHVVQTWLPQMDVFAGAAALLTRTPWVLTERSSGEAYVGRLKDRFLRPSVGRYAMAVVANSKAGAAYWRRRRGARSAPVVIRNALPIKAIDASPKADSRDLRISDDQRIILAAGRLAPEKNLSLLLDAFASAGMGDDTVLIICGDGPLRERLIEDAAALGLGLRARILRRRGDIWGLMKRASAFVNASAFEGHPNAVLEAAACRCPLVLSDIGAHRESPGIEAATFFRPGSVSDLANRLLECMAGGFAVGHRADLAYRASQFCSVDRVLAEYEQVYAGLDLMGRE